MRTIVIVRLNELIVEHDNCWTPYKHWSFSIYEKPRSPCVLSTRRSVVLNSHNRPFDYMNVMGVVPNTFPDRHFCTVAGVKKVINETTSSSYLGLGVYTHT